MTMTGPAMTALDLTSEANTSPIDQVLRTRAATIDQIRECLDQVGGRVGNTERRLVVIDSAMQPWSESERLLHRIMRRLGLSVRWQTNHPVHIDGENFYLDVAISGLRIAIEADGFEFHSSRDAFENDRHRQNLLVLDGWMILRFTWRQLVENPVECGRQILLAVRQANRRLRRRAA